MPSFQNIQNDAAKAETPLYLSVHDINFMAKQSTDRSFIYTRYQRRGK